MNISDEDKIFIKDFVARVKPITYKNTPTENSMRRDCLDYVLSVFPDWNLFHMHYFYRMVASITVHSVELKCQ